MRDNAPDIYDIEFKDIYEIEFNDLERPVEITDSVGRPDLELVFPSESSTTAQLGYIAVAPDLQDASIAVTPTERDTSKAQDPVIKADGTSEARSTFARQEIPAHIITIADKAIATLLATSPKKSVPVAQLSELAFNGQRVPKKEFESFLDALNQDERLEYVGEGSYVVTKDGDVTIKLHWPDEDPSIDREQLTLLADATTLKLSEVSAWGLDSRQILGTVKSLGEYLSAEEVNEFFALLSIHPNISPLENGNFAFKKGSEFEPQHEGFMESRFAQHAADSNRPMTARQISKTLKNIRYSPEFREMKEDMKRLANPRRRGRRKSKGPISGTSIKKGYQGKAHGKKVNLDSLLAQNKSAAG